MSENASHTLTCYPKKMRAKHPSYIVTLSSLSTLFLQFVVLETRIAKWYLTLSITVGIAVLEKTPKVV